MIEDGETSTSNLSGFLLVTCKHAGHKQKAREGAAGLGRSPASPKPCGRPVPARSGSVTGGSEYIG
ncbi:hypothetical protein GCM10009654_15670 [Streptomyces hebeiensis]|uniref:Transposase n=1 Tax=Streptomyces hebeiensis TaxID=229486 RepID=A0ABP4FBD8_9ACTN